MTAEIATAAMKARLAPCTAKFLFGNLIKELPSPSSDDGRPCVNGEDGSLWKARATVDEAGEPSTLWKYAPVAIVTLMAKKSLFENIFPNTPLRRWVSIKYSKVA